MNERTKKQGKKVFPEWLLNLPKNHSIPKHYVVILRCSTDACRRVLLQPLKISHQSLPCRSRHCGGHLQSQIIKPLEKSQFDFNHH